MGSNGNDGAIDRPWLTIAHALNSSGPGDTVNLRAGTYAGVVEMRGDWGHGGSAGNWWVLQSYPGETATVTGEFRIYMVSYCRIQGLSFAGVRLFTGLFTTAGYTTPHHLEIRNNTFTGVQQTYGYIEVHGNDILVEGNTITSTGGGSTQDHGVYVHYGANKIIRGNQISNTSGYGIHVYDERKSPTDPQTFMLNYVVEGNTIVGSRLRSGIIVSQASDTQIDGVIVRNNLLRNNAQYGVSVANHGSLNLRNVRVYNNTLYRNAAGGVLVYQNVEAAEIKNNIVWSDPGVNHLEKQSALPLVVSRNLYWTAPARLVNLVDSSPVVADPGFVDASNGDFHLTSLSPGVAAGETLAQVPTDKDGVARSQGWAFDVGAYEAAEPVDFNADGKSDIVWHHQTTGGIYVWTMNGAVQTGGSWVGSVQDTGWKIVAAADFNGDRKTDLLWQHGSSGAIYLWTMNGAVQTGGVLVGGVADTNWKIVGAADFTGDGKADILWHHQVTGDIYVWTMNGAVQTGGAYIGSVADTNWKIAAAADLNGDGKADLLWHHQTTGGIYVWTMNGAVQTGGAWVGSVADTSWRIAGAADLSGDRNNDLLWHHQATGGIYVWTMSGAQQTGGLWAGSVADTNWKIAAP